MATKREQIIDLINDYIYTNGRQRITAIQLNEILTVIANSYELVGEGSGGGISQVLTTDPNVKDNQKIINPNGGLLELSGVIDINDEISVPYMGILTGAEGPKPDPTDPNRGYQFGAVVSNQMATVIGNSIGINPFEYLNPKNSKLSFNGLVNSAEERQKEETRTAQKAEHNLGLKAVKAEKARRDPETVGAVSLYLPDNLSLGGEDVIDRGMYSGMIHEFAQNLIKVQQDRIRLDTRTTIASERGIGGNTESRFEIGNGYVESEISVENSDIRSWEVLYTDSKQFLFNGNQTLMIDSDGLRFTGSKRLAYNTDSFAGTAGVATLDGGSVFINTTAVRANSYVMLTVQSSGEFQGNIRISEKTENVGFRISSTYDTDNCQVLWQIIDINY